jgi:molybdopterin/thiamine biosynthesis adenylyltransferase
MTALEAIKLITGAGEALTGRLLIYDGLAGTARTVTVAADPDCPVCA